MGKPFLLQLSSVLVQQRDLLKLGMVIDSYNDHCSAPFSRACWLAYAPPTLLGSGSRHCHGINYTQNSLLLPPTVFSGEPDRLGLLVLASSWCSLFGFAVTSHGVR